MAAAPGAVRCGKVQRAKPHPRIATYLTCPVWSRGAGAQKLLSPMLLQNITIVEPLETPLRPGYIVAANPDYQVATATCFENYWQGSKIYACDLHDPAAPITLANIRNGFWARRAAVYAADQPVRRALPKAQYGTPIAGYYRGQIMTYVESRLAIYIPMYTELVKHHPTFLELRDRHRAGQNLLLVGPDGYDPAVPLTLELLAELRVRSDLIYGHELVLCEMLLGE